MYIILQILYNYKYYNLQVSVGPCDLSAWHKHVLPCKKKVKEINMEMKVA